MHRYDLTVLVLALSASVLGAPSVVAAPQIPDVTAGDGAPAGIMSGPFEHFKTDALRQILARDRAEIAKEVQELSREWDRKAGVMLTLTITVGILGIVIGILQRAPAPSAKTVTVWLGALISIITVVNNAAFTDDHRTWQRRSRRAGTLLREINAKTELALRSDVRPEDVKLFFGEVKKLIDQVRDLEGSVDQSATPRVDGGVNSAWAQAPLPEWTTHPPEGDANRVFFVGKGQSESLRAAKDQAENHVIDQAMDRIVSTGKLSRAPDVLKEVARNLRIFVSAQTTHVVIDEMNKRYTYYALYRIDGQLLRPNTIVASPAAWGFPAQDFYYIQSCTSGLYLDVAGAASTELAPVVQVPRAQAPWWGIVQSFTPGEYWIRPGAGNFYLSPGGGDRVVQSNRSDSWMLVPVEEKGCYFIRLQYRDRREAEKQQDLTLASANGSRQAGAVIIQSPTRNEAWRFVPRK